MYQLRDKDFEDIEQFLREITAAAQVKGHAEEVVDMIPTFGYRAACFVEIMGNARRGYRPEENLSKTTIHQVPPTSGEGG